jgi:hypothetical protein
LNFDPLNQGIFLKWDLIPVQSTTQDKEVANFQQDH